VNILPFVVQESGPHFRVARTFVTRALYLAASATVLAFAIPHISSGDTGTFARNLYNTFYWTTYAAVCLLAPVLTAHAVFRDKTAGLASVIAASPVTPMEYCVGRLLGQLAALGSILLVSAPIFVIMIFLHALSLGEVLKGIVFLALGGALSASLALGRAIDADTFPGAVASTYALTIFPGCLTPLLSFWYFATEPNMSPVAWAYIAIATPVPLAYNLIRAQALFKRRFVSEGTSTPPWQIREGRYRGPITGNPVYWWERTRAARILEKSFGRADSLSGAVRILAGLAALAALIPLCLAWQGVAVLHGLAVLLASAQAASSVTGDRERKVWPSLVSTSLPARDLALGKLFGVLAGLRFAWIAAGAGWTIHALIHLGDVAELTRLALWCTGLTAFGVLLVTAALHFSLSSETTAKSMGRTLGLGLLLGGTPFVLVQADVARLDAGGWMALILAWAVIGVALALALPGRFSRAALST